MLGRMKLALVQQHATRDKADNVRRGLAALDQAAAASPSRSTGRP
jgi:predicted amidohydrolase